jgi:hypothetical protein
MRQQPEVAEQREEVSAIQSADQSPIAREIRSSPATVSSTDNSRTSDEKADKPASTTKTTAVEDVNYESFPIEVGDEDQQFEVQLEDLAKEEEESPLALQSAPSKDLSVGAASVRSTRSIKSFLSNKSNKSTSSDKSNKPDAASDTYKSVKSTKSIGSKTELKASSSKDAASVCSARSAKSTTSNKSVKSTKSIGSESELKAMEIIEDGSTPVNTDVSTSEKEISKDLVVGEDDTSKTSTALAIKTPSTVAKVVPTEALAVEDGSNNGKWIKKVSLSIGGYKTSFQLTDPITGLTNAIRDALDVVGNDDALTQQAKTIDSINANDDDAEEERDYETNPTQLFVNIQQRAWAAAMMQLQNCPDEAKVWVYLKAKPEKAPNAQDAEENKEALVVQHSSLVVHDGNGTPKMRWKLLPLHAAIVLGAPSEVTEAILKAYPNAAKKRDERGSLPVHLAASRLDVDSEGEKIVLQLFGTFPDSIDFLDSKGRSPTELATLARARKEIAEQRKVNACNSKTVQHVERDVSQKKEDADAGETEDIDDDDDDDDKSVMSNISGRFKQMIRRSKSSDTAVRRRKKKPTKGGKVDAGLSPSKSVDNDCDDDTAAILPGFAFLTASKSQEMRERAAPAEIAKDEETEKTEKELLVAAKKELLVAAKQAIISKEYQTLDESPREVTSQKDIPLPTSFSMGDECSVATVAPQTSPRKESSDTAAPSVQTIEEACNIAEEESTQDTTSTTSAELNEGLQVLLEKAAENAGRVGLDVTKYVKILADEWVTDVEALRRLDSDTLDDLLPLMLSRELHKMIHQADGIDTKFLQEEGNLERGRSPKKSMKKSKKKRSHRRASKRTHHQPITAPEGPLSPISEIGENSASVSFGEDQPVIGLEEPMEEEEGADADEEEVQDEAEEEENAEITQTTSVDDDLEIRKLHANLIAEARTKFPTREELEDAIRERHNEVKVAINSGFNVDKEAITRAALADDEMRKLLPLRLILPTAADLHEMVTALQMHKEGAIREFDMEKARMIQSEIDELQDQLDLEKKYIRTKHEGEIKCAGCGEYFPTETKMAGILKRTEKFCQECRESEDCA